MSSTTYTLPATGGKVQTAQFECPQLDKVRRQFKDGMEEAISNAYVSAHAHEAKDYVQVAFNIRTGEWRLTGVADHDKKMAPNAGNPNWRVILKIQGWDISRLSHLEYRRGPSGKYYHSDDSAQEDKAGAKLTKAELAEVLTTEAWHFFKEADSALVAFLKEVAEFYWEENKARLKSKYYAEMD